MSKQRSITKNPLRAILSEVLPYEVPLPFTTSIVYAFLRYLRFQWVDERSFKVDSRRLGEGEEIQLQFIFDQAELKENDHLHPWIIFEIRKAEKAPVSLNPYKFTAKRNNGKSRHLTILHPQSMLEVARFVDSHADSILYLCSRSNFSLRYPVRVARVAVRKDKLFEHSKETEPFNIAQHNLEYDNLRSFFAYGGFNNINRFYSSPQFRACERKFPFLLRADISKCFDSIYTHSVSWVINGLKASKKYRKANNLGNLLDKLFQNLNYGETSGIVIGPEASRLFAEIILQEIDVLAERELQNFDLIYGRDYEVKRYVDDYFIFASREEDTERIAQVLEKHLATYKLHFNDQKTEIFSTPLRSEMSVAKHRISQDLKRLSRRDVDLDSDPPSGSFFFSSQEAILEYKSVLLDTGLEHGNLANFYLFSLLQHVRKSCSAFRRFYEALQMRQLPLEQQTVKSTLAKYLIACIDVALFIYAGAPSASHSLKLTEITVVALTELKKAGLPKAEMASFEEKLRREIRAQLNTAREARSFGTHTLNLVDCLTYLKTEFSDGELERLLEVRRIRVQDLDSFALLTLIRACSNRQNPDTPFLRNLLARSREIVAIGRYDPEHETERSILLLSLPHNLELKESLVQQATGLCTEKVTAIRRGAKASFFAWDANKTYRERLALKSSGFVY